MLLLCCTLALAQHGLREPDRRVALPDGVETVRFVEGGLHGVLFQHQGSRWHWTPDRGWRAVSLRGATDGWDLAADGQHTVTSREGRLVVIGPRGNPVARGPEDDAPRSRTAVWSPDLVARCSDDGLELGSVQEPRQQLLPGRCERVAWHSEGALLMVGGDELFRVDAVSGMPLWRMPAQLLPGGGDDLCVAHSEGATVVDPTRGEVRARVPVVFSCRPFAPGRLLWRRDDRWQQVAYGVDGATVLGPVVPDALQVGRDLFFADAGQLSMWRLDALTALWTPAPLPAAWKGHPLLSYGLVTDVADTHLQLEVVDASVEAALARLPRWWEHRRDAITDGTTWLSVSFPEERTVRFEVQDPEPMRLSRRPDDVPLAWADEASVHVLDAGGGAGAVRMVAAAAAGSMGWSVHTATAPPRPDTLLVRYRPDGQAIARDLAVVLGRDLDTPPVRLEQWDAAPTKVVIWVGGAVAPRLPWPERDPAVVPGFEPAPDCSRQGRPTLGSSQQGVPVERIDGPSWVVERVTWPDGVGVEAVASGCEAGASRISFFVAERPEAPLDAALALMDRVEPGGYWLADALRQQREGAPSDCDGPGRCEVTVRPTYDGVRIDVSFRSTP